MSARFPPETLSVSGAVASQSYASYGDGVINSDWRPAAAPRAAGAMPSKEEVRKAFALFDANGDGMISLDELKAIHPLPRDSPAASALGGKGRADHLQYLSCCLAR